MGPTEEQQQELYMRYLLEDAGGLPGPIIPANVIQDITELFLDAANYITSEVMRFYSTPDHPLTGTFTLKYPGQGCKTRKRLIKLMMSIGYSRDKAVNAASLFVDGFGWSCADTWAAIFALKLYNG